MATTQSKFGKRFGKFGKRFDEDFKREVIALASRPGASDTQVARDLGDPYSVGRWKQLFEFGPGSRLYLWRQRGRTRTVRPRVGT